jgi:hypothetical protein
VSKPGVRSQPFESLTALSKVEGEPGGFARDCKFRPLEIDDGVRKMIGPGMNGEEIA